MALQRRAVATNTDGGTASLTAVVNKPTGTLSGDTIMAAIAVADSIVGLTVSPPDGTWTQQTDLPYGDVGAQHLTVFTKTAGGSEPSTYSFTISGTTGGAAQAWLTVAIGYYSDAGGSAVVDQTATTGASNASYPNFTSSSITPGVANERVVSFFCQDQSAGSGFTWTPGSAASGNTLSELADFFETVTNFGMCADEEVQTAATATSHTVSNTGPDTTRGMATAILSIKEINATPSSPPPPLIMAPRISLAI